MANEKRICYGRSVMPARVCRVTITDILGASRTIEVQASSLFEAVAEGLLAIRVGDLAIPDGFRPVKVVVIETHTEYAVRPKDFVKWLDRRGNSPGDVTYRKKIRSILQLRRPG
jgi:hypothetical protein